jgi:pimeloyl-ACP methyl ester carboxylesterase
MPIRVVTRLALSAPVALPFAVGPATAVPAPASPRFADVRLSTGVRLRYLEQGDPAGRPVILIHGITDSWFSFSRVLPGISGAHRVYALDLRGHGDSDRPTDGYSPRDMAADVVAFMDALGIQRATLVGHSMGSFVAQQAALAAPERVAGLVLIGSATTVRSEVTLELQQAMASLPDTVPADFVMEFQSSTVHQRVPDEFLSRVVAESRKVPARVWRAALAGLLETERFTGIGGSQIPALLIWGDRDGMFSRAEQEALVAALPIASLKVYRETGHAPHWERPKEVVRDLERFLRTAPS